MGHTYRRTQKVRIVRTDKFDDVFRWGKHLFRPSVHQLKKEIVDAESKGIKTIYIHSKVVSN